MERDEKEEEKQKGRGHGKKKKMVPEVVCKSSPNTCLQLGPLVEMFTLRKVGTAKIPITNSGFDLNQII